MLLKALELSEGLGTVLRRQPAFYMMPYNASLERCFNGTAAVSMNC